MAVFLGVDVGTSGTKTLAMQEDGAILSSATVEYPLYSPHPGWSEQDPEDWWQATIKSIRKVLKSGKIKPADVKGIGLSGQMHGSVFLNKNHEVIRPALLWNDQRTAAECVEIEQRAGGRKKLIGMVANPALTGFTAPKILWLRNNEPRNFAKTVQVLLPKDYVRFRLTGEFATEVSDASGTLLLDVKQRKWSRPLLSKLELDESLLPEVYESEDVSGHLTADSARQLGLSAGVAVVGGGGDQAAGAIGNGIVKRGVISATMGTSGVVFAHSDEVQIDPEGRVHTFCHAVRDKWHVMGVVLSAGGSLQWYRDQLCELQVAAAKKQKVDPYQLITAQAAEAPAGSEGLFFLPYLTGERTPHADPYARAAWIGLSLRHGRAHLSRAVIEGATYAMRDSLEIIQELQIPVKEIRLSGGGARSPFWRQVQADIYGQKVVTINAEEGPAYGVALLAAAGTGAYKDVVEACSATIRVVESTSVNSKDKKVYNQAFPLYQKLYSSLKPDFQQICGLLD
ncbi:xylulokinase [Gimesia sp.]|uniref:xylulokinase n=1 Tax=Gimesia sp. TaxID=2024833 RepID=UPI000C5EA1F5|nr:xylulokinase [Gimesia sp.]MAX35069.1 xylulokinase [Gimesia sp.]HAH47032.1 xylulokinase [Planctomycetaceae bacterium]|tara:strand:+ start:6301 stop:7833 length:1533 start_codon:yes stop_codon:yes gene_type:complete